ncbi:MAG: hypothetical protein LPK14_08940 [Hymenobacteraceae bacterium]|nr:hypothetical protein [Hymenobacteraceae bacterium]
MKIIILLFAFVFGFGATVKRTASEMEEMNKRMELNEYKHHPNMLPEVEIVAERS